MYECLATQAAESRDSKRSLDDGTDQRRSEPRKSYNKEEQRTATDIDSKEVDVTDEVNQSLPLNVAARDSSHDHDTLITR